MRPTWLRDVTVVEVTDGLAGRYAAAVLASLGANVVALSAPWTSSRPSDGHHPLDADKRLLSIADELGLPGAVASASIVIADVISLAPERRVPLIGATSRLGQGAWVCVSAFGRTGPWGGWLGSDLIGLASGGVLDVGRGLRSPSEMPGSDQGLMIGGQVAALAALHGLDAARAREGHVDVDVSLQEAVAFVGCLMELSGEIAGLRDQKLGERMAAPTGRFPCVDGEITVCAPAPHQWRATVRAMGSPAWADEITREELRDKRTVVNARIGEWTRTLTRAECVQALQDAGVPVAEVNQPSDVLESDQLLARGFLVTKDGTALPGAPFNIESVRGDRRGPMSLTEVDVVEMTGALAGPLAGTLLGAMGARVVHLGDARRPDIYEQVGPFLDGMAGEGRSISFNAVNHSKEWALADYDELARTGSRAVLAGADIVIDNLSSSQRSKLGLDSAEGVGSGLQLTISGFGRRGPRAHHRAYGANVHSFAGLSATTPDPAGWPWEGGQTPLGDTATAVAAATVVAAWVLGDSTPCTADLSMAEVIVARLAIEVGRAQRPEATDRDGVLSKLLPSGDGQMLAVSIPSVDAVQRLRDLLVLHRADVPNEVDCETALHLLGDLALTGPAADWSAWLQAAGIPAFPVTTLDALASDPRLRATGFVSEIESMVPGDPGLRLGLPWRFADEPSFALAPLRRR